jgi:hypothetical protein
MKVGAQHTFERRGSPLLEGEGQGEVYNASEEVASLPAALPRTGGAKRNPIRGPAGEDVKRPNVGVAHCEPLSRPVVRPLSLQASGKGRLRLGDPFGEVTHLTSAVSFQRRAHARSPTAPAGSEPCA